MEVTMSLEVAWMLMGAGILVFIMVLYVIKVILIWIAEKLGW
jgi:hypothetical protein